MLAGFKIIISHSLILFMAFSLAACGKKNSGNSRTLKRNGKPSTVTDANKVQAEMAKLEQEKQAAAELKRQQEAEAKSQGATALNDQTLPDLKKETQDTSTSRHKKDDSDEDLDDHINTKQNKDLVSLDDEKISSQSSEDSQKSSDGVRADKKGCETLTSELSDLGWEKYEIEVPENYNDSKSRKIRVAYYKQKNSSLKNPMLFLEGHLTKVRKSRLQAFNTIAKNYEVDPILMDTRGAGCSSPLPDTKQLPLWQYYGSRGYAYDAEAIRKKELSNRKWKIWAHQLAGYTALRSVELFPEGISSLHITDFTPMKDYTQFMLYRIEAQQTAWDEFALYAENERGLLATDSDVEKARQTLKAKWPCDAKTSDDQKNLLCGEKAFDAFVYLLKSKQEWPTAAKVLESLIHGDLDTENTLKNVVTALHQRARYETIFRAIDLDSDKAQTACNRALEAAQKISKLKNSPINSCRIEVALGKPLLSEVQKQLKYDALNTAQIKVNLRKNNIDYYWMVADKSLFYPGKASEEHFQEFKSYLKDNDRNHASREVQIDEDPEFLKSLKPPSAEHESE